MSDLKDFFELASYVVTVVGVPFVIYAYVTEQRKERENEDEEAFQQISDAYIDFLKLVLAHPDLKLRTESHAPNLDEDQKERRLVIFELLISLFERAYILLFDERMNAIVGETRGRIVPAASMPNSRSRSSRNQAGCRARMVLIE